jgi:hypothetical protein
MVPSYYEEEYFCNTCSHTSCAWYVSKCTELIEAELFSAMLPAEALVDDAAATKSRWLVN